MECGDQDDIILELRESNRQRYQIQMQINELSALLKQLGNLGIPLGLRAAEWTNKLLLRKEKVASQESAIASLKTRIALLGGEREKLREEKRKRDEGGIDYIRYDKLKKAHEAEERQRREENNAVGSRIEKVSQCRHDSEWKSGELRAGIGHRQWVLDQARQTIPELRNQLNTLREFRDKMKNEVRDCYIVKLPRANPSEGGQHLFWSKSSPFSLCDRRRVWFEISVFNATLVLLTGSFNGWKCELVCGNSDEDASKFGVWVFVPRGRYEFLFLADGRWLTSERYPTVCNEHGSVNNCITVD